MISKGKRGEVVGLLGVGLDDTEGHKRITTSDEFLLLGGSAETHERMQELALRFADSLRQRGQTLPEISLDMVVELLHRAAK